MTALATAMLLLFNGQDLQGWNTLAGKWMARDAKLVCSEGPGSIRSSFESDRYKLIFQYRNAVEGENRLFVHARVDGGGQRLLLTSGGVVEEKASATAKTIPNDEWVQVELEVNDRTIHAVSSRVKDGTRLADAKVALQRRSRGFLRFETDRSGLEIRALTAAEPDFVPMFDGKTLKGWEIMGQRPNREKGWTIDAGTIKCAGLGYGSWLRTLRSYDNFVIRLEYYLPPKGNSGVYLRAPLQGRVSQIGLEIQLLDDGGWAGRIKAPQRTGSVYAGIAPETEVPAPAEQWNAIEITVDGKRVQTILNGVRLYDASLDDQSKDKQLLKHPLATRRLEGFIGLQDHTGKPSFRNVRIHELPPTRQTQPSK